MLLLLLLLLLRRRRLHFVALLSLVQRHEQHGTEVSIAI
jgi:hypothetical protein